MRIYREKSSLFGPVDRLVIDLETESEQNANNLGLLFNAYAAEFSSVADECGQDFVIPLGDVIVYLFGAEERKQAAWRMAHPDCGDFDIYFMSVSGRPVEIWGDVRRVKDGLHKGALVVNNLSLGHEMMHALRVILSGWMIRNEDEGVLLSPDKYEKI